jgi:hypothetical protein
LPDVDAIMQSVPAVKQGFKATTQARNDIAHTDQTPKQSIDELIAVVKVTNAVVVLISSECSVCRESVDRKL